VKIALCPPIPADSWKKVVLGFVHFMIHFVRVRGVMETIALGKTYYRGCDALDIREKPA
jgi:hypothetical protein